MTTIVTFATKDVIVMGSDSLGTASRPVIDPVKLYSHFDKEGNLKTDLKNFNFWKDVYSDREEVPYSHMAHMDKLFRLRDNIGVLTAGIVSIGNVTIKSIIREVATTGVSGCEEVVEKLIDKIRPHYEKQYSESHHKPNIELMVAGWDNSDLTKPQIYRIKFPYLLTESFDDPDDALPENRLELRQEYGIYFGGQFREIARLVHGTDVENMREIQTRHIDLLKRFAGDIKKLNPKKKIKVPDLLKDDSGRFDMFGPIDPDNPKSRDWQLSGLEATCGDFSDQNAINCVYWLIDLMIKVQEFGDTMPTVGGDIHIAIIDKKTGFKFLSQESYNLQGHKTPKI